MALVLTVCGLLASSGCSAPNPFPEGEGFAIYLTRNDIPPAQMEALSHVDIADQPVLSLDDIVAYDAGTHEMELTVDAFDRIACLEVPVSGRSFVVCVNGQPIYWGAFWTRVSSLSFDGVTIWKPFGPGDSKVIKLGLGYPSASFYWGEDPRNNAEAMESLEKAGKLTAMPAATTDMLPRSMKGYELYSWQENGQWHFTLITGTNRTKTMEEITSGVDTVSEDGWVRIHVVGINETKNVLGRLPQGESVCWGDRQHVGQTTGTDVDLQLPPGPIPYEIRDYAQERGLDFVAFEP